jgi:hypothetical protein
LYFFLSSLWLSQPHSTFPFSTFMFFPQFFPFPSSPYFFLYVFSRFLLLPIYIYMCVCVCVCLFLSLFLFNSNTASSLQNTSFPPILPMQLLFLSPRTLLWIATFNFLPFLALPACSFPYLPSYYFFFLFLPFFIYFPFFSLLFKNCKLLFLAL